MIEIKCDELQKEAIVKGIARSEYCPLCLNTECTSKCIECLEKNIKWDIRGNEDAE